MIKNKIVRNIKTLIKRGPILLYTNLYIKPKQIISLLCHTERVWKESYFPEYPRKSKSHILFDQLYNIIRYSALEEYYYMYGLDVVRKTKNSEYVTYAEFMKKRDFLNLSNPHNDSTILRNKFFFESIAKSLGIPTPKNLAYSNDGNLTFLDNPMDQNCDWSELSSDISHDTIYIKPIDGECGTGIIKLNIQNKQLIIEGRVISPEELARLCSKGRYIFQFAITQHPEMQRLYPNSVNTIRITTVRNPQTGQIEILPPTLRIGAHGSFVDNFSKGGVIVAMDTDTGKLSKWGFYKPMFGFKSMRHPDSDIVFSTFNVPYYDEVKCMATRFHSFLNLHSIGWDVAITDKGPVFIEGNDNWEINLPQTFENPFKKEFKRLFACSCSK